MSSHILAVPTAIKSGFIAATDQVIIFLFERTLVLDYGPERHSFLPELKVARNAFERAVKLISSSSTPGRFEVSASEYEAMHHDAEYCGEYHPVAYDNTLPPNSSNEAAQAFYLNQMADLARRTP